MCHGPSCLWKLCQRTQWNILWSSNLVYTFQDHHYLKPVTRQTEMYEINIEFHVPREFPSIFFKNSLHGTLLHLDSNKLDSKHLSWSNTYHRYYHMLTAQICAKPDCIAIWTFVGMLCLRLMIVQFFHSHISIRWNTSEEARCHLSL